MSENGRESCRKGSKPMAKTLEYEGQTRSNGSCASSDHQGARTREFSPEGLYATEQEADIHGTIFGQRLIDEKVKGQSREVTAGGSD